MYHRHGDSAPQPPENLLPPVEQPRGLAFLLKTWSGRLILLNLLVFIAEVYLSPRGSLNNIPADTLVRMGAKESVRLALGEYWRFVTPMFLHGNLLHILFNNWALYAVAYQLEALLGGRKFLLLYFLAGIGGNILSALWSLNLSVGASGSLFGLLGCAWYFERTIHRRFTETTGYKPRAGAYTVMVVANILFGFIIPQIDNAAHIGGLLVGIVTAYVLLRATPNRLVNMQRTRARIAMVLAGLVFAALALVSASPYYVKWRLTRAVNTTENVGARYFYLNELRELDASDRMILWQHLRLALKLNDFARADGDLRLLSGDADFAQRMKQLEADLGSEDALALSWLNSRLGAPPE